MRGARLVGIATVALISQPAWATATSTNLDVSVTVLETCGVMTAPTATAPGEAARGQTVEKSSTVLVTCPAGTGWTAALYNDRTHTTTSFVERGIENSQALEIYSPVRSQPTAVPAIGNSDPLTITISY